MIYIEYADTLYGQNVDFYNVNLGYKLYQASVIFCAVSFVSGA